MTPEQLAVVRKFLPKDSVVNFDSALWSKMGHKGVVSQAERAVEKACAAGFNRSQMRLQNSTLEHKIECSNEYIHHSGLVLKHSAKRGDASTNSTATLTVSVIKR